MTEEPVPFQVKYAILESSSLSTVEGTHHKLQKNQVRHFNIVQDPTIFKLNAESLDSPIREYHDLISQSSHIISEYVNIRMSVLS